MATVVRKPADKRFEVLGIGLGQAVQAGNKQRRALKLQEVINNLPPDASPQEIVAATAPWTDEPSNLAELLVRARASASANRLTPEQIRANEEAKVKGRIEAEARTPEIFQKLIAEADAAGNKERVRRLTTQLEKQTGKSLETIQAEAEAAKTGDLEALRKGMKAILGGAENSTEPVFGGGEGASGDFRIVNSLYQKARMLSEAGMTTQANTLLGQARFMADNSPEIQRSKELDKPISADLAQQLQLPAGTSMREALGMVPPSKMEEAESIVTGRGRVGAKEKIGFVGEARSIIGNLKKEMETDPGIVGLTGSLRAKGKTAVEIISFLGADQLVKRAKSILGESERAGEEKGLFSSPTLSALDIIENSVGIILARLRSDDFRLLGSVIDRSIADMKITGLTSPQQVLDRLNFIDSMLEAREETLRTTFKLPKPEPTEEEQALPFYRKNPQTGRYERIN